MTRHGRKLRQIQKSWLRFWLRNLVLMLGTLVVKTESNRKRPRRYCPTDNMIADVLTKPLQGAKFHKLRRLLLGLKNDDPDY